MGLAADDDGSLVYGGLEDDDDFEAELRALQEENDDDDVPRGSRGRGNGRAGGRQPPPAKGVFKDYSFMFLPDEYLFGRRLDHSVPHL